jgi:hypothetical protein
VPRRVAPLLAHRLAALLCLVNHVHLHPLWGRRAAEEVCRDIEAERRVPTLVRARLAPVDEHVRPPVDRPKVQQHSATLAAALAAALALAATHAPRRGQHEGAAIAHALDRLCDAEARQRRLGCEGHEDTMREADATGQVGGYLLPLPPSVEAEPARALHLRPRVLR